MKSIKLKVNDIILRVADSKLYKVMDRHDATLEVQWLTDKSVKIFIPMGEPIIQFKELVKHYGL